MQSNKTKNFSKPNTGKPFNSKPVTAKKPSSSEQGEFLERKVGYYQQDETVTTLYIGNLNYKKDEYQVKAMLEKFGKVKYVKIVVDPKTSVSKGIAFVQMPNGKHAKQAIDALNDTLMDGRTLKVSIAKQRTNHIAEKSMKTIPEPKTGIESEEIVRKRTSRRRPRGLKVLFDHLNK